jgi:LysR family glycine cleavage system transcriptional activator
MSVPLARLSSLDLIRGFVAVGRRMSITRAAQDLCITQSAVSRQISTLESILGVKLLTRGHRSIAFTADGDRLFRSANSAVQQLQDAIGAVRADVVRPPVTITCTIGIAGLWLLPRLRDFQQEHPGVDVRIAASDRVEDLRGEGIDLAIRYCAREGAPDGAQRLFGETVVPVAHPALAVGSLDSPRALERHFLLEFEGASFPWLRWHQWLASQGWDKVRPKGTLRFNQYDQVIAAAVAGQGIAIGRLKLLGPMLADGRLKILAAPRSGPTTSYAYWLIQARPNPRPDVLTTANWIRAQAEAADSDQQPKSRPASRQKASRRTAR